MKYRAPPKGEVRRSDMAKRNPPKSSSKQAPKFLTLSVAGISLLMLLWLIVTNKHLMWLSSQDSATISTPGSGSGSAPIQSKEPSHKAPTPDIKSLQQQARQIKNLGDPLRQVSRDFNCSVLWGTYRSGHYYGLRTRTYPETVALGIMWHHTDKPAGDSRHECRQEHEMKEYGWKRHDGRSYGYQTITDRKHRVNLETQYLRFDADKNACDSLNNPLDGTGIISVVKGTIKKQRKKEQKTAEQKPISVVFYLNFGLDVDTSASDASILSKHIAVDVAGANVIIRGSHHKFGDFEMTLSATTADAGSVEWSYQGFEGGRLNGRKFADRVTASLSSFKHLANAQDSKAGAAPSLSNAIQESDNAVALQLLSAEDFTVVQQLTFGKKKAKQPSLNGLTDTLNSLEKGFHKRFEDVYKIGKSYIGDRSFNANEIEMAEAALSNLLGGISFFYGSSIISTMENGVEKQLLTKPHPLYTAVPSRSFFPRGFLWDEGFHQLLISSWDQEISENILAHWLSAMETEPSQRRGWIPREQILGAEARDRVPEEFVVQHEKHANPPTLFLLVDSLLRKAHRGSKVQTFLRSILPRLEQWYLWFRSSQVGQEPFSFRWRGRYRDGKLFPNTLASGLDDYPRSSEPSDQESHLDLHCWVTMATEIMSRLHLALGNEDEAGQYRDDYQTLVQHLDSIHWDDTQSLYADVGLHSQDGSIEKFLVYRCQGHDGRIKDIDVRLPLQNRHVDCPEEFPNGLYPLGDGQGGYLMREKFVSRTIKKQFIARNGYVSLFPLLLKLIPADSPKLEGILKLMEDPSELWSEYGLRSLSTKDVFYERENAPGDKPYWRGAIWLPVNYLAVSALKHYADIEGPFSKRCNRLYGRLREALISNVMKEYTRTGYLWEQYSGENGKGQRSHPFTGWTALIVKIMAEDYY